MEKEEHNLQVYPSEGVRLNACADYIRGKYESAGYQVQKLLFEENGESGLLVQIRNTEDNAKGILKTVIGCKACVSLKLLRSGNDLNVSVMATSWLDKGVVLVAAWFFLWPLLVTGGYGVYQQKTLLDNVRQDVLNFFANNR